MSVTMLIIPRLADKHGRKRIFVAAKIFDCLFYTIVVFSKNYYLTLAALLGLGMSTPGRLNVGMPYLNEWFPTKR